jgi:hypothetical protein
MFGPATVSALACQIARAPELTQADQIARLDVSAGTVSALPMLAITCRAPSGSSDGSARSLLFFLSNLNLGLHGH